MYPLNRPISKTRGTDQFQKREALTTHSRGVGLICQVMYNLKSKKKCNQSVPFLLELLGSCFADDGFVWFTLYSLVCPIRDYTHLFKVFFFNRHNSSCSETNTASQSKCSHIEYLYILAYVDIKNHSEKPTARTKIDFIPGGRLIELTDRASNLHVLFLYGCLHVANRSCNYQKTYEILALITNSLILSLA